MSDFMIDGESVLPPVKSDVRPAMIPQAETEWCALDANEFRQALLDLRLVALHILSALGESNVIITIGDGYVIAGPRSGGDTARVSDALGVAKA